MNPTPTQPAEACARRVLDVVPRIMRTIRQEMRGATGDQLSMPQFRALALLGRRRGASLSAVSDHLGVADATASTLIDRLVRRGLVTRQPHPEERRRVALDLTPQGLELLEGARARARSFLAQRLAPLGPERLERLTEDLGLLENLLDGAQP